MIKTLGKFFTIAITLASVSAVIYKGYSVYQMSKKKHSKNLMTIALALSGIAGGIYKLYGMYCPSKKKTHPAEALLTSIMDLPYYKQWRIAQKSNKLFKIIHEVTA